MATGKHRTAHRATYSLERGIWYATCNECGHRVSDATRRRTATLYREHIKLTNGLTTCVITAGTETEPAAGPLPTS